jgi:flagellar basal body L-ring protein FlgH
MKMIVVALLFLTACGLQNESAKEISRSAKQQSEQALLKVEMVEKRLSALESRLSSMERLSNFDAQERNLYSGKLGEVESEVLSLRQMFKESKVK